MIKTIKSIILIAFVALGLSSCMKSSNETTTEQAFPGCFAYVWDLQSNTAQGKDYSTGVAYQIKVNYTTSKASVTITNLKVNENVTYPKLTLEGLGVSVDDKGWLVLKGSNVTTSSSGVAMTPIFDVFELKICDRIYDNKYYPGFRASYMIDGRYDVYSAQSQQVQFGTTKAAAVTAGTEFTTTETEYWVKFNFANSTATILMQRAMFVQQMPAMNIVLEDVPVMFSAGVAAFNVGEIVPKIGNTPYPGFKITNLVGTYDFANGLNMQFNCNPETMPMDFHVSVDATYYNVPENL